MKSTDDVAAQFDFNFKPGDMIVAYGGFGQRDYKARHRVQGIIVSIDVSGCRCKVMWSTPDGGVKFSEEDFLNLSRV